MFDAMKVKNECVDWIRGFFETNGAGCNAVVGISGGKDSSTVAALCVDYDAALSLVTLLRIRYFTVNIEAAVNGLKEAIPFALSEQSRINLPARIRMAALYAVSQSHNGRVANTCNLSEDWVGYATRYGDGAGDFSPCSRLTVQEVKAIGRVLGLPEQLVEKTPIDGLSGKTDEESLGFTYEELDRYIRIGKVSDERTKARIDRLHEQNLFKLQPMPYFDPDLKTIPL